MTSSIRLYCDLEWARVLIQAFFPIGSFTGLMVMNLISDTRGRRQAFLIALSVTVIGIICKYLFIISLTYRSIQSKPFVADDFSVHERLRSRVNHALVLHSLRWFSKRQNATKSNCYVEQQWVILLINFSGIVSIVLGFFYIMKLNWLYFVIIFQLIPFLIVLVMFCKYLQ